MDFLGGPTDRVGDSYKFFVRPLSKLCVSDTHFRVREKHCFPFFTRLLVKNNFEFLAMMLFLNFDNSECKSVTYTILVLLKFSF